jgi:AraC family transcriptional regulator of adaptative response / DNA-3-methyladenine glycosylase II
VPSTLYNVRVDLDRTRCRRASVARDRRFDGVFFTGVRTTGIYCRPVCPVALPKAENVTYYPSAASCEEAGFRPCRRCRPETAPGTPAWVGSSTTVARALRLIDEDSQMSLPVEDLGRRLGVGSRHLRRLFAEHLGASPLTVIRTRRVQFARHLIDQTDLSMAQVAASSGFASIRQFNQTIRETFGKPPTALRRVYAKRRLAAAPGEIALRLPYRPPFDWKGLLDFLSLRAIPGVEHVDGDCYRRVIDTAAGAGSVEVSDDPSSHQLICRLCIPDALELAGCVEAARRLFDLGANPLKIGADLGRDPLLARCLSSRQGIRVPGAWDPFELSVRAILGQQVSVKGATTLSGRLVDRFGKRIDSSCHEGLTHVFPAASVLADADVARIGLPKARAAAIRAVSKAVADGELCFAGASDAADTRARMCEIPGIGDWTAQYVSMRALGDSDAFPSTDLGLIKAISTGRKRITPAALRERSQAWRPWRAYAAMCLWSQH